MTKSTLSTGNLDVLTIYDINHSDEIQVSDITPLLELTNLLTYTQNDDLNTTQKKCYSLVSPLLKLSWMTFF